MQCNIRMDWEGTIQVISVPSFVGFKPYSYRFMYNTRYRIQDTGHEQNTRYRIQDTNKIQDQDTEHSSI